MSDLQALLDHIQQIERHTRSGPWEPHPVNDSQLYATYVAGSEADSLEPEIAAVVSGFDAEFIALARTALPQLAKTVRAVLELHKPQWSGDIPPGGYICAACNIPVESEPCPTVQAITDALGADDD